jgi:hypothetical protein
MTGVELFIAHVGPDGKKTEIPISESRIDIDTLINRSVEFRQLVATARQATGGKVILPPHFRQRQLHQVVKFRHRAAHERRYRGQRGGARATLRCRNAVRGVQHSV